MCAPAMANGRGGAFVISLDLELRWGTRDARSPLPAAQLLNAREVVHRLLDLFHARDISATWCAVGMLFAESRDELGHYVPKLLPSYQREELNPYREKIGFDESDDPLHFGASLIRAIQRCPSQEIGSHTFSHFYCLEPGQTRQQFEADLSSARRIAAARNIHLRSLVFPRNQVNRGLFPAIANQKIACIRGASPAWVHAASEFKNQRQLHKRALRLADSYLPIFGNDTVNWPAEVFPGLMELKASRYFRPYTGGPSSLADLAIERMTSGMEHAAHTGGIYHLWFHPEDFGLYPTENIALLRRVLDAYATLRDRFDMRSLAMADAHQNTAAATSLVAA